MMIYTTSTCFSSLVMMIFSIILTTTTITTHAQSSSPTSSSGSGSSSISTDVFNYDTTVGNDYGPKDWGQVKCNNDNTCLGYPDTVPNSQGWTIGTQNQCIWCPDTGNNCGAHHNSPIDLNRGLDEPGNPIYNQCIDGHYIRHFDSSCSYQDLREQNAFTIERYALKIKQPMSDTEQSPGFYNINCTKPTIGRRWGRMDYPKGWSNWWLLSHIDFHVPSEHTQNGKRYDAEVQIHHYYSVTPEVCHNGIQNTVAAVSIFLEAYDDAEPWPQLDMSICAWREAEEKNRESCGLPSIATPYPGCYFYGRKASTTTTNNTTDGNATDIGNTTSSTQGVRRRRRAVSKPYKPAMSAFDLFYENHHKMASRKGNESISLKQIQIDPENYDPMEEYDWSAFIAKMYEEEEQHKEILRHKERESIQNHRRLLNYEYLHWYNYFPFTAVRTEYYFRYSGSQTYPPCYGKFDSAISGGAKRENTMAWRVMKDPIRVASRQIDELHRLLKERISPSSSLRKPCQPDTGAAPDPEGRPGKVWTARPLQSSSAPHWATFCQCQWHSHFIEDQKWCRQYQNDNTSKYYTHPYNFDTVGF